MAMAAGGLGHDDLNELMKENVIDFFMNNFYVFVIFSMKIR